VEHPAIVAIGIFLAHLAVVVAVWRINRVNYDEIFSSRETVVRGVVVPLGLGAVLLAVATTWLGWWRPVLFEDSRTGPTWALAVPVLFGIAGVLVASQIDVRSSNARVLPLIAVAVLIVGFAEEVATRGVLNVGTRDGG
jgi:membrane protease YdiL (CAAX protease family)